MADYTFTKEKGLEFGLYTLGDHLPDPKSGKRISAGERVREIIELAKLADQAGLDFFSVGESHQEYFATQAHAVVLSAIAQATKSIRIGSSSTIISTSDPVRVYENFATIDLISQGRAEIIAGRASRVGLFELLGYDIRDYEALYEEKFDLLLQLNEATGPVNWRGDYRNPLREAEILPQPEDGRMPVWRAVGGTPASAVKAGKAGVPMMMAMLGGPVEVFQRQVETYRDAAKSAGHDPDSLPVAAAGFFHVADTHEQAKAELYPYINAGMQLTNNRGFPEEAFDQARDVRSVINIGSPEAVIEKLLHQHEAYGHQRYIGQMDFGGVPFSQLMRNIDVIGEKILPALRKYTKPS
ncbi:LLM class flavin-dependent oxidoreductase [Salisediminibacterium selenitireducens]|uniref:Luciferase-like, subgroup n=1 Tax=Bacillus selenitireducens (strain ATCC 700615 / DSM 15326 / MLS10) TaxID=439292 RepID=D6XZC2_BACIE|nr:LLM class flavin-dependent oxidoreductase [Salisediminibacterium selenitireducens]ADI00407.1 Luciferase-like, subgroup [[Bacillus] selenitireducens MLS10]